jgi:SAM-dependent methyltransferase
MRAILHPRNACRTCGSNRLRPFLHFDDIPLTDDFLSPGSLDREFTAPLDLYWCGDCHVVQTQHDVEVTGYYRDYRYTVSRSHFARHFMQRLAEEAFRRFELPPGSRVIEIGSGDGYQLACFSGLGARVLGFEPSDELTRASLAAGVPVTQCLFTSETVREIPPDMRPAQVVLLTYTFDHLPDPVGFLRAVREILDPRLGVLIIEVHDLGKILTRLETCLFAHEHSIYLNLRTLKRLLEGEGFRLLNDDLVGEDERRANSLLTCAVLRQSERPGICRAEGPGLDAMEEWKAYEEFAAGVRRGYDRMREYVRSGRMRGTRFAGYGAGGRGVLTLAMAGLGHQDVEFVCDQNVNLHGLLAPGSRIPVVSPQHLLADPVDEVIVFSFGYMDEIRQTLGEYLRHGGRLVSFLDLFR